MGAVMGSKNLRAVAVSGSGKSAPADPKRVRELGKKIVDLIAESPTAKIFKTYGTTAVVMGLQKGGLLPTRNFQAGQFEGAEAISGDAINSSILVGNKGCFGCPIRCKREVKVSGKYETNPAYGGPEYETLACLGSLCGIDNLEAVARGNQLCNAWGLDSISTGVSIAFSMECTEKGILTQKDTDGVDLRFGNADGMLEMIRKISLREGFGDILADGVKEAAKRIGNGAAHYAMHVKGQELPAHDPRGKKGVFLSYATSPTGADHIEAPHDTSFAGEGPALDSIRPIGILEPSTLLEIGPRKIRQFVHTQLVYSLYNSLGICNFAAIPVTVITLPMAAEIVNAVTGWDTSVYELMKLGERGITMARMFNHREGISKEDDTLPDRLFEESLEGGPSPEKRIFTRQEVADALRRYYEAMGWDPQTGIPTDGRLDFLGLDWLREQ
jgi:aldehyde:ferredoxin oxidoreductase